jgi:hypothetical protein
MRTMPPQNDLLFWRRHQPIAAHDSNILAATDNSEKMGWRPLCGLQTTGFLTANLLLTERSEPTSNALTPARPSQRTMR